MNTSKILNVVLALVLVFLSVKLTLLASPADGVDKGKAQAEAQKGEPSSAPQGEWQEITPFDIKNPFSLLGKDWMALATGKEGDMNAMTIAWGTLGELWKKHVVIVYVSSSRYTHRFMERNDYFTVTAFPESQRKALTYLGTHSGRDDKDKVRSAGLTTEFTDLGNPIFKEGCLAIECRKIYSAPFNMENIEPETRRFYDNGTGVHTMYIGEIVHVWKK